ncbi:MAG: class I adenylate-forming enzyme family protein [Stellaceae bacterium]
MNLAALLFDVARRQPEAPAISDSVHAWSYREFARRISCLAGGLAARGLKPGDRVMLCMENCAEILKLLFACWTAGLCAVPVNARLHVREVEHIARDCRARLLVATPNLAERLAPLDRSVEPLSPIISTRNSDYTALLERGPPCVRSILPRQTEHGCFTRTGQPAGRKGRCLATATCFL